MKRWLLRAAAVLFLLAIAIVVAFRVSPWPSVALITYMFSEGDQKSEAALAKYVPPGIVTRRDIAYGPGRDEVFDLYRREADPAPSPTIVWVHGGGFIAGSKDGIANYMRVLAGHGYAAVAVEYSTGYGSAYPKPVEQVNAALGFIMRRAPELKVDPSALVLAGDSAGAHIASQVALLTNDAAYAKALGIAPALQPGQLSATLLLSGAYDPYAVNMDGDFGWFLKTVLWAYTGVKNIDDDERLRLTSIPVHVSKTFPPTFVSSGNGDPLAPQARTMAAKLREAGVVVDTLFFPPEREPALPHEYQFNLEDPAGREALERMLKFLQSTRAPHTGSSSSGQGGASESAARSPSVARRP